MGDDSDPANDGSDRHLAADRADESGMPAHRRPRRVAGSGHRRVGACRAGGPGDCFEVIDLDAGWPLSRGAYGLRVTGGSCAGQEYELTGRAR